MSEPKGIYKTQLKGVAIYGSNQPANSIMIDSQTLDHINALLEAAKSDLHEAQALIDRQAEAIRQRDKLFMRYYESSIDWMDYIAEMQALMSSTSVTGGDER